MSVVTFTYEIPTNAITSIPDSYFVSQYAACLVTLRRNQFFAGNFTLRYNVDACLVFRYKLPDARAVIYFRTLILLISNFFSPRQIRRRRRSRSRRYVNFDLKKRRQRRR